MTWRPYFGCCLLFGALLCLAPAVPAQETNRVLAVVGNEVITSSDLERLITTMEATLPPANDPVAASQRSREIRDIALQRLIEDKLFGLEAARLKVEVEDEEVEAYLNNIKQRNRVSDELFAAQLSRRGISPEDYRREVKLDILKHKLVRREVRNKVVISDDQVAEYYKNNPGQYDNLDKVAMRAIFLSVPDEAPPATVEAIRRRAQEIQRQATRGADFGELARANSEGPGAGSGGELGAVNVVDLLPAMRQALAELKPGEISPVVEVPGSFVIMQLLERLGTAGTPLAEVREQIREKLEREAFEKRFRTWMEELRSRVHVRVIN